MLPMDYWVVFYNNFGTFNCFWISSLIPVKFKQEHGEVVGNDAYMVVQLFKAKKLQAEIYAISALRQEGKFEEAIKLFENEVKGVSLFLNEKEWKKALALFEKAKEMNRDTDGIDQYLGLAKSKKGIAEW